MSTVVSPPSLHSPIKKLLTETALPARFGETIPGHAELREEFRLPQPSAELVRRSRRAIADIMNGADTRILVIVGPCAVVDPGATLEYAQKMAKIAEEVSETMLIVQRVYHQKPRTSVGWKGIFSDPHVDGTHCMGTGIKMTRRLMLDILELGLPIATEFLDIDFGAGHYIDDLVSWGCIGARTTTSQPHRQFASDMDFPIGFKNSPRGDHLGTVEDAANGVVVAGDTASFIGQNEFGKRCSVRPKGNRNCHVVLRGTLSSSNCDRASIDAAASKLRDMGVNPHMIVDCSHDNSKDAQRQKDFTLQARNFARGIKSVRDGIAPEVKGFMIESDLLEGSQKLQPLEPRSDGLRLPPTFKRGQSATDACLSIEDAGYLIRAGHRCLLQRK